MLKHKGTVTIETPRLILRKAKIEDAEAMFRNWANDPEVTKFLTWPTHGNIEITKTLLESWVENYQKEDYYQWMIVLKEIDEPIGSIMANTVGRAQSAHIGYCIGKTWWHQGIMSETLKAVMDFLFDEVGYHRIEAMHDSNNPHSGAVMKKCGMRYEGTLRMADRNNQGICDACYYGLLTSER
jgi:ribosomal-protein-alanine N-acetyltransferase